MEDQSNTFSVYKGHAGRSRRTFCRICEAACGLRVDVDATGQLLRLRPDPRHPISRGYVCAKGTPECPMPLQKWKEIQTLSRARESKHTDAYITKL